MTLTKEQAPNFKWVKKDIWIDPETNKRYIRWKDMFFPEDAMKKKEVKKHE